MQTLIRWVGVLGGISLGVAICVEGDLNTGLGVAMASLGSASIIPGRQ